MTKYFDKNGQEVFLQNGIYWSNNFDRFWELLAESGDSPILIMYGEQDKLKWFYRYKVPYGRSRYRMNAAFREDQIRFFDPEIQQIYTE